jgi:hypothetical protein
MTRDDALADFLRLKHSGGQHLLAAMACRSEHRITFGCAPRNKTG